MAFQLDQAASKADRLAGASKISASSLINVPRASEVEVSKRAKKAAINSAAVSWSRRKAEIRLRNSSSLAAS
jgi:hypothetical protein